MVNKFKYIFLSLARNKVSFLLLVIQFTSSFILLNMAMDINVYLRNENKKIEKLFGNNEIYGLIDSAEKGVSLELSNAELNSLYADMRSLKDHKFVSFHTTEMPIHGSKIISENNEYYHGTEIAINDKVATTDYVDIVKFDESLLDYINFNVSEGKFFEKGNFYIDDYVPIVLGSDFKGIHHIGDVFYAENNNSFNENLNVNNSIKLKVIGILEPNTEIPLITITGSGEFESIDNFIMLPYFTDDALGMSNLDEEYNMYTLESIITGSIITHKGISAKNLLQSLNQSQDLIKFDLLNVKERFDKKIEILEMKEEAYSMLSFMIIIFSTIGTVMILLSIIKRSLKEYSIHLLSGASINDISKIILGQILFIIVFSMILTFMSLSTISSHSSEIEYSFKLINIVIAIVITLISWKIPERYIKNMGIIKIIRGEY